MSQESVDFPHNSSYIRFAEMFDTVVWVAQKFDIKIRKKKTAWL